MSASFVVYIDESGDEGFRFDSGSSRWLVLSAAIFRKESETDAAMAVRDVRDLLNRRSRKALHFVDLKHEQRVAYVTRIAKARMRCTSVLVHKPSLYEPEKFESQKHRLYRYTIRYLIERVSWFCRDFRKRNDPDDGTAEVVFSHRRGLSYDEIKHYLNLLRSGPTEIYWPAIDSQQIQALPHQNRMGLQIADAVASSFYQALEANRFGNTEDRYVKILRPVVWRREGKFRRYGVKLWPREADAALDKDGLHAWLGEYQ